MKSKNEKLWWLFKKQGKEAEERIKNMENSMYNSYNIYSGGTEYISGIKSEGVLHGWKF